MDETTNDMQGQVDTLLEKIAGLGEAAGKGADTLPQFGMMLVNAAYDGLLDLVKNKHGEGIDDAVKAYATYAEHKTKAALFNHKTESGQVQASKARNLIRLGGLSSRLGRGQPIKSMNKLVAMHKATARDQSIDLYQALQKFGTAQFKSPMSPIVDDDELKSFILKPAPTRQSLVDYLEGTAKRIEDLQFGRAQSRTLHHKSGDLQAAMDLINKEARKLREEG